MREGNEMYVSMVDYDVVLQQRETERRAHEQLALLRSMESSYTPNTSRRARLKAQLMRIGTAQLSLPKTQEPGAVAA
jgi:hypothetical protein